MGPMKSSDELLITSPPPPQPDSDHQNQIKELDSEIGDVNDGACSCSSSTASNAMEVDETKQAGNSPLAAGLRKIKINPPAASSRVLLLKVDEEEDEPRTPTGPEYRIPKIDENSKEDEPRTPTGPEYRIPVRTSPPPLKRRLGLVVRKGKKAKSSGVGVGVGVGVGGMVMDFKTKLEIDDFFRNKLAHGG